LKDIKMSLEYELKKTYCEKQLDQYIDYLCKPLIKQEVYLALEEIASLQEQIQHCEDVIYAANIPEFDDPLN
tara:strand:+ start:538 stop:753 length:216 start_codon:yes stop_codon:yes gene_type:complete